jgi:hypothetical protein
MQIVVCSAGPPSRKRTREGWGNPKLGIPRDKVGPAPIFDIGIPESPPFRKLRERMGHPATPNWEFHEIRLGQPPICLRCGIMKYQLVLQFAAASIEDFDRLVALEDSLIEELDSIATVDGHDFGVGEFNIFILTNDPNESFKRAQRVVTDQEIANAMRSAYRQVEGEEYVILWPSSLKDFKVL